MPCTSQIRPITKTVISAARRRSSSAAAPLALSWSPLVWFVFSEPPDMDTARLPSPVTSIGVLWFRLVRRQQAPFGVVRRNPCDKNHSARLITTRRVMPKDRLSAEYEKSGRLLYSSSLCRRRAASAIEPDSDG